MNNDFKFLIINTRKGWAEGEEKNRINLEISDEGISLKKDSSYLTEDLINLSGDLGDIRDLALDDCDFIYILDGKGHLDDKSEPNPCILKYDPVRNKINPLKYFGGKGALPGQFEEPQGITLSNDTLYVADTDNHRIQAFARANWQIRWIVSEGDPGLRDSEGNPIKFRPFKLVLDGNENIYVLDSVNNYILKFNEGGKFQGKFAEEELKEASPVDITIDNDGNFIYVLDKDGKIVLKFETKKFQLINKFDLTHFKTNINFLGLAVDSGDNIYLGEEDDSSGTDKFIYKLHESHDDPETLSGETLLGYRGPCYGMVIDNKQNIYVIGNNRKEITVLKPKENRYIKDKGVFISRSFDSHEIGCKWHKIVLEADIPHKTQIDVYYYASDNEIGEVTSWKKLGTFQASDRGTVITTGLKTDLNIFDALVGEGSGRYLKLKLELISSDEYNSPKIRSLRLFLPRISYLRYLPAVYQEDPVSKDFLERFLSLFETFYWNLEEEIDNITKYFDAEATPPEFLAWLATWLAAIIDENWSEKKKREFLKRAVELYKMRGTREGIEEIVKIYTGNKPIIVENWQLYQVDDAGDLRLRCEDIEDEFFLFNWNEVSEDISKKDKFKKEAHKLSNFPELLKFVKEGIDGGFTENVRVFKDNQGIVHIQRDQGDLKGYNISTIILNLPEGKATLNMYDGRVYDLKAKNEGGDLNIYVKNPFEKLFGEPTPFSFCLLLAPYIIHNEALFSIDATEVVDTSKLGLNRQKLKIQLQGKEDLLSDEYKISDKSRISNIRDNAWIIDDNYLLLREGDKVNFYKLPEKVTDSQINTVRRIINLEKPAHTIAGMIGLQPWIYLDMHTYLGINTFLSKPSMQLGIRSVIGRDTILDDPEVAGQIDKRSRTGLDTRLT